MNINQQLKLKRSFGLIAYLLLLISFLYMYFHKFKRGETNIFIDLGIILGIIIIAGVFIFLTYYLYRKIQTNLKEKAKSLDPKNYHFFILDYHKSFGLTPKDSILKNLFKKAQEDLSPEDFELFTQAYDKKKPIEKRKIVSLILMLIILILVIIFAINYFIHEFFVDGPRDINLTTFVLPLLFSNMYLLSFLDQSLLERLNADLKQRSNQ